MVQILGGNILEPELNRIAQQLKTATSVEVGFLSKETYPDGTLVSAVAVYNEFGTARTPPRPFFRNMVRRNSAKWPQSIKDALQANDYNLSIALDLVGQQVVRQLQESISSNTPPPNAASTVKRKGHDRTLIDTGLMLNSVTHRVK